MYYLVMFFYLVSYSNKTVSYSNISEIMKPQFCEFLKHLQTFYFMSSRKTLTGIILADK